MLAGTFDIYSYKLILNTARGFAEWWQMVILREGFFYPTHIKILDFLSLAHHCFVFVLF